MSLMKLRDANQGQHLSPSNLQSNSGTCITTYSGSYSVPPGGVLAMKNFAEDNKHSLRG